MDQRNSVDGGADDAAGGPAELREIDLEMDLTRDQQQPGAKGSAVPAQVLGQTYFISDAASSEPSPRQKRDEFAEFDAKTAEEEARGVELTRLVSYASLAASCVAAFLGIGFGIRDETISLVGFGLEATLDGISSALVIWRFKTPKGREHANAEAAANFKAVRDAKRERNSGIGIGATFVFSSALLLCSAAYKALSWDAERPEHKLGEQEGANISVLLSVPSAVIFGALALAKFRLAAQLDSEVLRKDALCSVLGAVLALIVTVAGLAEEAAGGDPQTMAQVDASASAVIALILLVEGSRTLWHNLGSGWQTEHHQMH
jgi:hypothetical protein